MSIFSKLFKLFVTVVLLPLIPMALLLAYYQSRQKASLLENHYNLAEVVSSELPRYAEGLNDRLTFATSLVPQLGDPAALERQLQTALQLRPQWRILAVLNAQGAEVARAFRAEIMPSISAEGLLPPNKRDYRLRARLTHTDGAIPSLEFVYPLVEGYSLYGRESLTELTDRLAQMRIGQTGQVYLADPSGLLRVGPFQWDPGVSADELEKQFSKESRLIGLLHGKEGALVGAISSEPRLGVYVTVLQPKDEALRSLYLSNTVIFLFLLAIAMLAYFGAQAFARSLGEPIAWLIQGAQEVSHGNLEHQISKEVDWDEFKELIASFNKMTADLKDYQNLQLKSQVSEMKEQVYRSVAHDLRAPLMGLQGYIYILSSGQVSDQERKDYLLRMSDAAQNLSSLLEDVLAVSRVEAGMSLPQRENITLLPLLQSVLHTQQPIAMEKGLNLSCTVSPELTVYADPKLLRRMMMNLISNAVKFTDKGFIQITAEQTEQQVCISVQDSGRGITAQEKAHIFEKFRQGDSRSEGYGLGLFISRQLARAHGGDLTVTSAEGEGSTFTLQLPKEEK